MSRISIFIVVILLFSVYYVLFGGDEPYVLEKQVIGSLEKNTPEYRKERSELSSHKKIITEEEKNEHNNNYSTKLDKLLSNESIKGRNLFIKEIIDTLNENDFYKVLNEYKSHIDKRSDRRIISSAILSEIKSDSLINLFYEEVKLDENLLADFVSATYYTDSQNSFDKLMKLQELNYQQQAKEDLEMGTLMMYQGNVTRDVISHVDTWLSNRNHINKTQENIIVGILMQSSISNIKELVNNNIHKLTLEGQGTLQEFMNDVHVRE